MPVHELCSIIHRSHDGKIKRRCRPVADARRLTSLLLLRGDMTADSALKDIDALPGTFQSENKDDLFSLIAPAPAGLLVIDEVEMSVLSYYEGEAPGRFRLVQAMVDYKRLKLAQKMRTYEDASLIIEEALSNGRVSHAEVSDVRVEPIINGGPGPNSVRRRLVAFARRCKEAMGASWMAASVVIKVHPWTVENYASPFGNRDNITAIRERVADMGLPQGKEDHRRWGRHWKEPSSKELF